MSYPQAVGELTKEKFTIAVCGAHGKSTTASIAALMLARAGLDPTVIIGTRLKEFNDSNFRYGKSKYLVLEADEWRGAFWNYYPNIVIITNIDREHLDFYKNIAGVKLGFRRFLRNLYLKSKCYHAQKYDGKPGVVGVIVNKDSRWAKEVVRNLKFKKFFYSAKSTDGNTIRRIIKIPGEHNISNALAVMTLAKCLKIPKRNALRTIRKYKGSWRRFEYRGRLNGAKLYDDYGHHPTEIVATLAAARSTMKTFSRQTEGKLWCVFQPHQYQRLKLLFRDFARAFGNADRVLILPVYSVAGREQRSAFSVNSEKLASAVSKNKVAADFVPSFGAAAKILKKELKLRDVCVLIGAGDIVKIHEFLLK